MSEPVSFLAATACLAAAALPLAFKLVPPNRLYGFRTARTLADRPLWFRVNRFGGWALLLASAASAGIYLRMPEFGSGRSFQGLLVLLVPLGLALAATLAYARRADGA